MKKLFLHIGFYKTGSTSLQKDLAQNAAALQAQDIFYPYEPRAPYTQRWQHAPLAAALPGRELNWLTPGNAKTQKRAYKSMFAAFEASGCSTLVLSSEGFCDQSVGAPQISWLQEKFADFEITVIAYIRRQDAYFLSTYQEMIKAGSTAAFDFSDYAAAARLHFARRLAPWRAALGAERVIVRPFAPAFWPEGELFYDFLSLIGTSREGLSLAKPENEGLDYRTVELLRQLNILTDAAGQSRRPGLRQLATASDAHFAAAGGGKQKMQVSAAQAETLRSHFRAENESALAGSGISADDFFPAPPKEQEERLLPERLEPELLLKLLWEQAPKAAANHQQARGAKTRRKPHQEAQNRV